MDRIWISSSEFWTACIYSTYKLFRIQMNLFRYGPCSGCYTIAACLPFEPLEKRMTSKDIFPGLPRTLSFNFQTFHDQSNFQDFPGPGIFGKNPGLSRRSGNPESSCRRAAKCCGGCIWNKCINAPKVRRNAANEASMDHLVWSDFPLV